MITRSLAARFLFLAAMALPHHAKAPPPGDEPPGVPGEPLGGSTSDWIAPYVKYSAEGIGPHWPQTLTWFSADGSARTQAVSLALPALAYAAENGQTVAIGINDSWKVTLPQKPDDFHTWAAPDSDAATPDSRTFIRPFTPEEGQIAVDVYVHGVLANTLGPFVRRPSGETKMNDDGSIAMLIWKDANKTTPQIVCADRDGKLLFQVDCDPTGRQAIPAPDGAGAVIEVGLRAQNHFAFYTRAGQGPTMEIAPDGQCIAWVPATLKCLYKTRTGHDDDYHMIDWASGKELWAIPCPGGVHAAALTITPRLVIFVVAEHYGVRLIRAFYAVRVEDGRVVAHGHDTYPSEFSERDRPRLMQVRNKIYFLTTEAFFEINEEDILAGRNGWKPVTPEK